MQFGHMDGLYTLVMGGFLSANKTLQLENGFIYPSRNGIVRYESVMKLRNKLEELSKLKGIAQHEKGICSENGNLCNLKIA